MPKSKNVQTTFLESMSISKNRDVMCKQTVTFFQCVMTKQHARGMVSYEYIINLAQFRTTMHISCRKI